MGRAKCTPTDTFQYVFRNYSQAVLLVSGAGQILDASSCTCKVLKTTRRNLLKRNLSEVLALNVPATDFLLQSGSSTPRPLSASSQNYGAEIFGKKIRAGEQELFLLELKQVQVKWLSDIGTYVKGLEKQVEHQNGILQSLHDTVFGLMNRLDLNDLLQAIVGQAAKMGATPDGYIYLVNFEKGRLEMPIGVGMYEKFRMYNPQRGEGLGGTVWAQGSPIILDNYSTWPKRLHDSSLDVLRACVSVPLKSGDQVVGTITLTTTDNKKIFQQSELLQLIHFAEMASIALENARLYTSLRQELVVRQQAEEALHVSAERLRAIIESAKDYIYVKDKNLIYIESNHAASVFFGRPREAILGRTDNELLGDDFGKGSEKIDREVLLGNVVEEEINVAVDGESRTFDRIMVPLRNKGGEVVGICGIARDITERKRAEVEIIRAREQYARAERLASLGTMAAGISHEINQPLNSIKITATGLLYSYRKNFSWEREDIIEDIEQIVEHVDCIDNIIKHMRSFVQSKRHGTTSMDTKECNINEALERALGLIGTQLATHGIKVLKLLEPDLPSVLATYTGLEEVIINLMVNAMEALNSIQIGPKQIFSENLS